MIELSETVNESQRPLSRARQWEAAFVDLLDELRLPTARILYFTSRSLADELERNTLSVAPLLTIAIVAMLVSSTADQTN